jgi:hypothetical protein
METPENGPKGPRFADILARMGQNAGFELDMLGDRLMAVSLVRNPLNPHARIISVSTPRGFNDLYEGMDQEC